MPGFEEEAFARAQRISRSRPQKEREKNETHTKEPQEPLPQRHEDGEPENPPEKPLAVKNEKKQGLLDTLFKDKEKSIILALILLLGDENSDPSLLLALAYLLI